MSAPHPDSSAATGDVLERTEQLPTVEELAQPVVSALLDLYHALGERAEALEFPVSRGERQREASELVALERHVADIVATATGKCAKGDQAAVESATRFVIEAVTYVQPLGDELHRAELAYQRR
jgi:hypothetical protein